MSNSSFSTLRTIFFPIHGYELKKFLPMAFMMLFVLFNYTVLRNIKDSLVVNAKGSDAEIISFLKLWGTMPAAVLAMLFYSKLTNLFNKEKIFYILITPFIAFFGAFAFLIYPNVETLHPAPQTIYTLQEAYPHFKWFISMWGNWSYCLFYVLAELWGSVVLSLLFWQFANDITPSSEAKRFYPLFGFIGNLGLILAGATVKFVCGRAAGADEVQYTLNYLMPMIVLSGGAVIAIYRWMNKKIIPEAAAEGDLPKTKKKKPKLSMGESFKYIFTSPHLLCIAVLVFSYGITINFIDVLWKGQVKLLFQGNTKAYLNYMGSFSMITGIVSLPLMLLGSNVLRRFSWFKAACVVPIILLSTGALFYGLIIYGSFITMTEPLFTLFGVGLTAVMLSTQIGLFQNAVTKASKYSLFDSTKEMAYIPLDNELKTKGKAAVDVAGSRLGKSGGALTLFVLGTLVPGASLPQLAPILAAVSFVIFVCWFLSIGKLSRSLSELQEEEPAVKTAGATA